MSRPCPEGCACGKHNRGPVFDTKPWPESKRKPHGTRAALMHHYRWNEDACAECLEAERQRSSAYRQQVTLRAMELAGRAVSYREAAKILRQQRGAA